MGSAADQPRWGLGEAVLGFVAGLLLSGLLASAWLGANPGEDGLGLGGQALASLGLWAGLVGAVVYSARRKGSGSVRADFGLEGRPVDLAVGAAAGVGAQVVLVPVVALLLRPLLGEPDVSGPVRDLVESAEGVAVVGLFLFVAVGAPAVEELFFRGLVLRALSRRLGTVAAVVGSSVLFGLAHPQDLPGEALALVMTSLAVLAALFAVLVVKTGRLGPAIVAHAVFNAWTLVHVLTG
ncbi:MAG TPA: CPBP family intramembrane glutamic endopeptidase [Acidimicrobiales bacterium]|nr:CPBP family intramembrane glutamic endopeptidase [Acidimicrobiales bacterium]